MESSIGFRENRDEVDAREPDCISQAIVVKQGKDAVTIGINHPLAGVALNFDIKVVGVRERKKSSTMAIHMMVGMPIS